MSEEEILEEIKRIFLKLTEGEPSPDDEIEAKDLFIECFKILRDGNLIPNEINLIDTTLNQLENWDTLDLWFKEVDGLTENIERLLNLKSKTDLSQQINSSDIPTDESLASGIKTTDIDISEVVAQITSQFKGEIDNLKSTIEGLQNELHTKEEKIKKISDETIEQEEITHNTEDQEIPATYLGRLAPPKIKIPSIRTPKKSLKIKAPIETEGEITEQTMDEVDVINAASEKEESEKLMEIPKDPTISQITLDELKKMLEPEDAPKSIPEVSKKSKLTPIITEEPSEESLSEIPFELSPEIPKDIKPESKEIELTPLPVDKPALTQKTERDGEFTPLPEKEPENLQETSVESVEITEIPMEPSLTSIPSEASEKSNGKAAFAQLISDKPKISPIKVEEIDTDEIQSSSSDLFNVFSTVGHKTAKRVVEPSKSIEPESSKGKKKKEEKKKKHVEPPKLTEPPKKVVPLPSNVVESSISEEKDIDSLPMDRETLYQELIALEGKRYSLEKGYKGLSESYESGKIDEYEFKNRSDGLKSNLDEISSRIAKIRSLISSL